MNRWRMAGLLLVAVLVAWLTLRGCTPQDDAGAPPQTATPARDTFHASRPLRVAVVATSSNAADEVAHLERELRHLLMRGRMRLASDTSVAYTLQVSLDETPSATLRLLTPAGTIEREQHIERGGKTLDTLQALAATLPTFLGAVRTQDAWKNLIGTADSAAYDIFLRSTDELLGPRGRGFTQPLATENSPSVDRLEALLKREPGFARARALLALAYLALGGKDEDSLTQLAEAAAEQALAEDSLLLDARSALGLVSLRRGNRTTALAQFTATLDTDPAAPAALEGLACLLMDAGRAASALSLAQRAVALQPTNIGANECLAYAQLATGTTAPGDTRARLLDALLSDDIAAARRALPGTANAQMKAWTEPLLRAAEHPRDTPQALRALTRAANDGLIDPVTEIVSGAALKQADFVFNRLQRLQRQNASVPLRILWLPRTAFLRKHPGFATLVNAEKLPPFWKDHGLPDICTSEPAVYGCQP